jgi:hypothetical protein
LTVLTHGKLSELTAFEAFPMNFRKIQSSRSENADVIPSTIESKAT